ncbi:MAG TPA: metallophosphoesterase [bacterium]|nr:metallophosphoesterase [bacterium]
MRHRSFFIFFFIFLLVMFGLHYYLWARLVRDTDLRMPWRALATSAIILLGLLIPLSFTLIRTAPRSVAGPLSWVVYLWMGAAFFLVVLLALGDLARLPVKFADLLSGAPVDEERRRFLNLLIAGTALWGSGALSLVGLFGATAGAIRVKQVRVALKKWPQGKDGYRVAQITDLHVGPTIGENYVRRVVGEVMALKADLIVITGDLVDGSVKALSPLMGALKDLKAKDGVFFITGNHEYYTGDVPGWYTWLQSVGIRPLENERVSLGGGKGFDLAGLPDLAARQFGLNPDLPKTLAGWERARPLVLLAHQPVTFLEARAQGVDLQLSGHTHGGQMFPFNWLVRLAQPYIAGLYREGDSQLYVSCGTGYWGPPMRLGTASEITLLELVSAS